MHVALPSPRSAPSWQSLARLIAGFVLCLLAALWLAAPAHAAPPPAGSSISNQASASYSDGSGVPRTVTSNSVQTFVTQVYALTLTANGSQTATPGSIVTYAHTLTNTGNGADTFNLAAVNAAAQAYNLTNIQIFLDNGSGQPTGSPITTSTSVAAGATFKFVVTGQVPLTATAGQTNQLTVTATSVGSPSTSASNTDTTTVTNNAVITLSKSVSAGSGAPGSATTYFYTITYTNTGNSTAGNVKITDAIPAGLVYQTGTARWSVTGITQAGTPLSESGGSVGTSPNTISSTYTLATNTLVATIASVAPGQSGQLTFGFKVGGSTAPGILTNTAVAEFNNNGTTGTLVTGIQASVDFSVTQSYGVNLAGATVASASAGSTVSFTNVVTNTGNGTDTFNITVASATSNFPSGTQFQLYKSDGATLLSDSNNDGTPDTGPIPAGGTYNVILKAILPPNASGTGPFTVQKTARSTGSVSTVVSSTGTDTLTTINPAVVDLTNNLPAASGVPGFGAGPEASAQVTNTVNPGASTTFTLVMKNTGPVADTYDLAVGANSTLTTTLPSGWTVTFKADGGAGNCSTTGATITNTGTVTAGNSVVVCASVSVPAGYAAGTVDVFFRAKSPSSVAVDVLHDAVTVNAVRSISLTPNGNGQTFPGGSYTYTHTLTNNGNVPEGTTNSTLGLTVANNGASWTAAFYIDNPSTGTVGALDANDTLVSGANLPTTLGLAPGQSATVFVKVIAPAGATPGSSNTTTVTITPTVGVYSSAPPATVATDSTSVIAGNLNLEKLQALDATCAGNFGAATFVNGNLNAGPGQCVLYRITVSNVGAADATGVVVSDSTPTFTTLSVAPAASPVGSGVVASSPAAPAVGATGPFKVNVGTGATAAAGGTLSAGQSVVITFGVKIDN